MAPSVTFVLGCIDNCEIDRLNIMLRQRDLEIIDLKSQMVS